MKKRNLGFTIVELSVVAVIIAILAVLGTVSYKAVLQSAVDAGLKADIKSAENILNKYYKKYGDYPSSLDANSCPLDSNGTVDTDLCLQPGADNSYNSYSVDNTSTPPSYSITVTNTNGSTQSTSVGNMSRSGVLTPSSTIDSDNSTTNRAYGVATSSDNKHVYILTSTGISIYNKNFLSGNLTSLSKITSTASNLGYITLSPDGTSLYYATGSEYRMFSRVPSTGLLTAIGSGWGMAATGASGIAVSPDGTSVYIANQGADTISMYSRNTSTGSLAPLGTPSIAAGDRPTDIVVSPEGTNVYVVNNGIADKVSMFVRDTETGILSALGTPTLTTNDPEGLAISPDGLSVYVVNEGDNTVSMYSRDKASGLLTPMSTATIATGSRPTKIAISSDGKSIYVLNGLSGNISMYARDTTTGKLTSIGTAAHPYVEPFDISISNSGDSVYVTDKRSSSISTYIRH